jgi:predicted ATPase
MKRSDKEKSMLNRLRLIRFKSFADAELLMGPFTLLVGSNASGKSNLRDAFRLLNGIGQGYTLAEISGGKWFEGEEVWSGIRGGIQDIAFQQSQTFVLEISCAIPNPEQTNDMLTVTYEIEIASGSERQPPFVYREALHLANAHTIFEASPFFADIAHKVSPASLFVWLYQDHQEALPALTHLQPAISQLVNMEVGNAHIRHIIQHCLDAFAHMRFLELNPEVLRRPAFRGPTSLGDHGEYLSVVLQHLCTHPMHKQELVTWVQMLTPMDAVDFIFPTDSKGQVRLTLVEANGQHIPAYNASDGTLRLLGLLAVLLAPQPYSFVFLEELENGIHPTRLYLPLQIIQEQTSRRAMQVVATTHSPQLLLFANDSTLHHTSLTYRLETQADTRIKRILDLPDAPRLVREQDIATLHSSGWLENTVAFLEDERLGSGVRGRGSGGREHISLQK